VGFIDWVIAKWAEQQGNRGIDYRKKVLGKIGSCLRGWNSNWGSDMKKRKQDLLLLIKSLDQREKEVGLSDAEWR